MIYLETYRISRRSVALHPPSSEPTYIFVRKSPTQEVYKMFTKLVRFSLPSTLYVFAGNSNGMLIEKNTIDREYGFQYTLKFLSLKKKRAIYNLNYKNMKLNRPISIPYKLHIYRRQLPERVDPTPPNFNSFTHHHHDHHILSYRILRCFTVEGFLQILK